MIIRVWHEVLQMPKKDRAWHEQDMADEYAELLEANGLISRWSELSDVAYTYSRSRWSGHTVASPVRLHARLVGYVYMFPKYSLRYVFFRRAGQKLGHKRVKEVRNPRKIHKLHHIAGKYQLDQRDFAKECQKQLKYWPLLP